jgi:Hemerythrin HHE cation binding domain
VHQPTAKQRIEPAYEPVTLVRKALAASAGELSAALEHADPTDRRRHKALDRWFMGLATQIRRHHELVDTLVVPSLAARGALDDRALDTLADDHSWIDDLLGDIGDALGVLSFGLGSEAWWLGKACDLAAALEHVLKGQLAREDRLLTPLVRRWFAADEQDVVRSETVRAVATGPTQFSLAWLSVHIDDDERESLTPWVPLTSRLRWRTRRGSHARTAVVALG